MIVYIPDSLTLFLITSAHSSIFTGNATTSTYTRPRHSFEAAAQPFKSTQSSAFPPHQIRQKPPNTMAYGLASRKISTLPLRLRPHLPTAPHRMPTYFNRTLAHPPCSSPETYHLDFAISSLLLRPYCHCSFWKPLLRIPWHIEHLCQPYTAFPVEHDYGSLWTWYDLSLRKAHSDWPKLPHTATTF